MIVSFDSRALQQTCCVLAAAEERLGEVHAQALVSLIADLEAFENVEEMLAFVGHDAAVLDDDSLSLSVGSDYRAAFVVAGAKFDRTPDGRVIWSSVTRLKLANIVEKP